MLTSDQRETMHRAERLYEDRLKSQLEQTSMNAFVVIEPESGDYFVAKSPGEAAEAAHRAHPGALTHIMRVGHRTAFHIGGFA
jgi:hypothetical protein